MSFKKSVLSVVAAAAVATSAFAGTTTMSTNGKGDYLVYPAYYATTTGWQTNIRVVNTNTTMAVVAKVVVREYATSKELLDFPIYLTPGDVWTGDLINQGSCAAVNIVSNDDSNLNGAALNQPLYNNNTKVGTCYGYVEILAVAEKNASSIDATTPWKEFDALSKTKMRSDYDAVTNSSKNGWGAPTQNLFGNQVVKSETVGSEKSMITPAIAANVLLTSVEATNRDISKAAVFATDTQADAIFYGRSATNVMDGMMDHYRAAIAKTAVHAINYTNEGVENQIILTQPFKHTNPDADATTAAPYYAIATTEDAYINTGSVSRFYYIGRTWDEAEHTYVTPPSDFSGTVEKKSAEECPTEICYIYYTDLTDTTGPINTSYASGWVNLTLGTDANGTGNMAVPTLSHVMTGVKLNDQSLSNFIPTPFTAPVY
jgi:hypothetical protein